MSWQKGESLAGSVRLRALASAALAASFLITLLPSAPAVVASTQVTYGSPAAQIVALARSKVGATYRYGTEGPSTFDCSGLVIWTFKAAGYGSRVGNGQARSAYAMYHWFLSQGLASRTNPQVGDVVVWGGGTHVGIYVGNGMSVSALNPSQGVRLHTINALTDPFTAYLHTQMSGVQTAGSRVTPKSKPQSPHASAVLTRVTTTWLNLRRGPARSHHVITVLAPGSKLRVLGAKTGDGFRWLRVSTGGRMGWVAAKFTKAP